MCGIAGIVGKMLSREQQRNLLRTMERRGPDASGVYEDELCTLLHSRLAIVDPDGGKQPMSYSWEGESYVITYNGELYNTQELRKELEQVGHVFATRSDTEVLLRAYIQWKERALDKLNGIFAFAVWERRQNRLFLARDRLGVKPLFYYQDGMSLIFASEIKSILSAPGIRAQLDETGILQIVMLGPGKMPGSGVFRGISELRPGEYAFFEQGKLRKQIYWKLTDAPCHETFPAVMEKVRYLVTDAIKRQMVSDVPIGAFLSGGLDSSLITAVCAKEVSAPLPTFSVDYENNERYFVAGKFQPDSDSAYIQLMQSSLGTKHFDVILTPQDLIGVLEEATYARDLPGMADVDFSLLAFCGQIRKHVKVALSGECADEIFGGYPWFRDSSVHASDGFPWSQNIDLRRSLLHRFEDHGEEFVRACYTDTLQNADILPDASAEDRRVKEMVNLNLQWFMQTLLDRKDRMSMYHGLEVRVPFCDHRIAEYLYTVPWRYKEYENREKGLLRKAMEGLLPERILWRKKSPYPKTFDPRYTELVEARMDRLLKRRSAPVFDILRYGAVKELLESDSLWPWYGQLMRRPQTLAYILQINTWLERYSVDIL